MENRECIEILKNELECEKSHLETTKQIPHSEEEVEYTTKFLEALDLAIQALEKQEPKKPVIITNGPFDDEVCPNCKEINIRYPAVGWMYKHCPDCGQALKEIEDE